MQYLHVACGTGTLPTASVKIKTKDQTTQAAACGDGPVDAAYEAIRLATGQEQYVPIVGFAYSSYDARNACITAIDAELLEAPAFDTKAIHCRDIGSPLLFICCRKEFQWWSLTTKGVEFRERVSVNQIDIFFKQHRKEFSPESIYRAKNLSRVHSQYQLK
ncbi:unnamed protein product, partial [marine sediment metagenome]